MDEDGYEVIWSVKKTYKSLKLAFEVIRVMEPDPAQWIRLRPIVETKEIKALILLNLIALVFVIMLWGQEPLDFKWKLSRDG